MMAIDGGYPGPGIYYHTWTVSTQPDPTGSLTTAPYGGPLTNISVSAQWTEE